MKQTTYIKVQFVKEGIHYFPRAGEEDQFKTGDEYDVSHLANAHSHYFYFYVTVAVYHDDRDIEFLQFRRWLESLYASGVLQMNNKSCEMLAKELTDEVVAKYGERSMKVEVFEDNINGAIVETTF